MRHILILIFIAAFGSGCSIHLPTIFDAYRIDIQQGNALESEDIARVEIGMTTDQVRYILGSPVIDDNFHADRWDYVYYLHTGDDEKQSRRFLVFFENGLVSRTEEKQLTSS